MSTEVTPLNVGSMEWLGPLPTPALWDSSEREHCYDATQMLAYAATEVARAVAAERERCARLCDEIAADGAEWR